ncbi:hypothetical protein Lser_V15G29887 [Lactuca serriola]
MPSFSQIHRSSSSCHPLSFIASSSIVAQEPASEIYGFLRQLSLLIESTHCKMLCVHANLLHSLEVVTVNVIVPSIEGKFEMTKPHRRKGHMIGSGGFLFSIFTSYCLFELEGWSETLHLIALLHSRTIEEPPDNFLATTTIPRVFEKQIASPTELPDSNKVRKNVMPLPHMVGSYLAIVAPHGNTMPPSEANGYGFLSYEHFLVIYCKFWELDTYHDLLIDKENLIRYGNHPLTYRIVDRIFSQVPRKFTIKVEGKMGCEDFVCFILSEEDKSSGPRLEYWFKCIDLDGNGVLTRNELQFFYEEQLHRMECMAQESVLNGVRRGVAARPSLKLNEPWRAMAFFKA